jgi:rubrerythrin
MNMVYETENNLKAAFAGESAAYRRYMLFAEKAVQEGYPQAAKLFRAVAEAEVVHARNHMNAYDAIGATKDNLLAASMGEHLEFTEMYPAFISQARVEKNDRAEFSFSWANAVEKIHYAYFEAAFKDMKAGTNLADETYYVCQTCGNTVKGGAPDKCSVCGAGSSRFKKVE